MSISRDQALGLLTLAGSLVGVIVYGILLFSLGDAVSLLTLQVTAFLAAASILGILAWIGYTLATTPPPKPIEEIEKEIEAELKGLEETKTGEENLGAEGSE
jgi:predicted DNA-binding transcriptional regulator